MGIGYDEFFTLNPRKLNILLEGFKLRRKVKDEEAWLLGGYTYEAVSVAVSNVLRKKGQKAKSYFEVLNKPLLSNISENKEMTEEEKQKQREALMAKLHVMQTNFNLKHGK